MKLFLTLSHKKFEYYWSNTWIPSAIVDYVKAKNINVSDLIEKIENNELIIDEIEMNLEKLDKIKPEIFFLNAWYLTIREAKNNMYTLDFPNLETKVVMKRFFVELLQPDYDFSTLIKTSDLFYRWITEQSKEEIIEWLELLVYKLFEKYKLWMANKKSRMMVKKCNMTCTSIK